MNVRWLVFLGSIIVSVKLFAFPCYFTLAKDSCWTNYNVKVIVLDAESNQQLFSVDIPKGQSWIRQPFTCQPGQKLRYEATFQPSFWQSEQGKTYKAQRFWSLPATVGKNETAWDIPVCYPAAFAEVPLPPDAIGNCECNFKIIPAIKPQ